jgi:predicted CXXCH cytochrome family protein
MIDIREENTVVCHCVGITEAEIKARILKNGSKCSVSLLGEQLGCGLECGSCIPQLQELMGDNPWIDVVAHHAPLFVGDHSPDRIELVTFKLKAGVYPAIFAGQHLAVQARIEGRWVSRSYTIIRISNDGREVHAAIRRDEFGVFTPYLLDSADASQLQIRISAPIGPELMLADHQNSVCFVGGIGITFALSLLNAKSKHHRIHIDYSAHLADQIVPIDIAEDDRDYISVEQRLTSAQGRITDVEIQETVKTFEQAKHVEYYICGPTAFVNMVEEELRAAQVPAEKIHTELFYLTTKATEDTQKSDWKSKLYYLSIALLFLPLLLLMPQAAENLPSNHFTVGHEQLKCAACHIDAPGTLRQQLQAKAAYLVGSRSESVAFVYKPINNAVCLECHSKPKDNHPSHRFWEPRFEEVRQSLAPQLCLSCHREHTDTRVSLTETKFCVSCHSDLVVKNDPLDVSHEKLIKDKNWGTCMGCHDFHGNHERKAQTKLADVIAEKAILDYFVNAKSPYGEVTQKAKQPIDAIKPIEEKK